ncbi:MAG: hypothetical protein WCA04_04270 [Geobacteraceae bacterium]
MKRCRYPSIALILFAAYTLIALSPLAPLALKSPTLAHAITGQCSGDCDICGCSPERRAAHTCCCWMKKKREQEARAKGSLHCCTLEREPDCCSGRAQEKAAVPCCEKQPDREHGKVPVIVYRCSPCGTGTAALFPGTESYQHLPYLFSENLSAPSGAKLVNLHPGLLMSRYQEPPDPPPRLSFPS